MNYNLDWLIQKFDKEERLKYLFFWGHQPDTNGTLTSSCFSQWWMADFEIEGVNYPTSEHWMMAEKARLFNDEKSLQLIMNSRTPKEAKDLGRAVKNFEQSLWEKKRYSIVVRGNLYKFSQNTSLKNFLVNTLDRILVEASPVDTIWGIGLAKNSRAIENPKEWRGLNLLGFALMEVRDQLK